MLITSEWNKIQKFKLQEMDKNNLEQQSQFSMDKIQSENRKKVHKPMDIKIVYQQLLFSRRKDNSQGQASDRSKQTIQLLEQFPIEEYIDTESSQLNLKALLYELTISYNISFQNGEIHFYLEDAELYMNCGIEPLSQDIKINPIDYLNNTDGIRIKVRQMSNVSILHKIMTDQNPVTDKQQPQKQALGDGGKGRRTKQRRIGYIIQKVIQWRNFYSGTPIQKNQQIQVIQWRNFYSGTPIQKNQQIKLSLEDAAKQVNISKKSLDDYLFQIRFGHRYHFNFNEHYNDKVGVLRDFVRQKKKNDKTQTKVRKNKGHLKLNDLK